jgi:hypothetical protein
MIIIYRKPVPSYVQQKAQEALLSCPARKTHGKKLLTKRVGKNWRLLSKDQGETWSLMHHGEYDKTVDRKQL